MAITGGGGAILVWRTLTRGELNLDAMLTFFLLGVLSLCAARELVSTLQIDENGISYNGFTGKSVLKWSEIIDVHTSPHVLYIIAAPGNGTIRLHYGTYAGIGIGLEPFDELCAEVTRRSMPWLSQMWAQQVLPLVCRSPGITRQILVSYAVPVVLLVTFFLLFVVMTEGMLLEKILFLFIGFLIIVPFWVRDYRKNCRTLIVTADGIKQTNGRDIFIAWANIQEILITEEALGFGSIIVKGRRGIEIRIPRSTRNCGAVLYWLRRYGNLPETFQPIMTEKW